MDSRRQGSRRSLVEIIAFDVENAVPTCAIILKRDLRAQLHQLFLGKLVAQPRVQIIGNVRWRLCHGISQFNDQSLRVIKGRSVVAKSGAQLFIAEAGFSAHGRIDVYSEGATDARCGANTPQLNVTQ